MKLCIAGKNNIAVDILLYSLHSFSKSDICVIVNKTENFKNTWQKSLGFYAKQFEVEILQLKDVQEIEDLVFVSLEFDRIIKPSSFKSEKLFNIHFSFLPEYKGMYTSLLPILHGKLYSGVTLHKIDSGIDTGNIIEQKKINIEGLTCGKLYYKYLEEGTILVKKNLQRLTATDLYTEKQPLFGSTYYSKSSYNFNETEINLRQTSYQISLQVNGLYFRPYQLATLNGFKICKAELFDYYSKHKVGTIIHESHLYFEVQTIDSVIRLYKDYYDELLEAIRKSELQEIENYCKIVSQVTDINEVNKYGWNPIIIACYYGNVEAVKIIHSFGGRLNSKNLNGTTTLMYAKSAYESTKDLKLIEYLLDRGVSVKSKDVYGKTIFDYTNDSQIINLLMRYD